MVYMQLARAGHMHHIQGAGAEFHAVKRELSEALHKGSPIKERKDILTSRFAGAKMIQLPFRLCRRDIAPKYFQSQGICEFRLLQFPNRERIALRRHPGLHPLGPLLAEVEFKQRARVKIQHTFTSALHDPA